MKTILVVDDMAIFREPIAAALRKEGYEVRCSANGVEALASVTAKMPDLILLDVAMPQMDGLTFLKQLQAVPRYRNVPVILLTAVAEKDYVLEAMKYRIRDYLLKSHFSLAMMMRRVRLLLDEQDKTATDRAAAKAATEAAEANRHLAAAADQVEPLWLVGSILFLDDQEAECRLAEHLLRSTRIRLTTVTQLGQALDLVKRRPFDIVMIDHDLDGDSGEQAARRIVDGGYNGSIVMMTDGAGTDGAGESKAVGGSSGGASGAGIGGGVRQVSIAKPIVQSVLFVTIRDLLAKSAAMTEAEAVTSQMASDPSMSDLIVWYVDRAKVLAHEIRREVERSSFDEVRKRCQVLKETGGGYGFAALSEVAQTAITALDAGKLRFTGGANGGGGSGGVGGEASSEWARQALENATTEVRRLEELCKRLTPMSTGKAKLAALSAGRG